MSNTSDTSNSADSCSDSESFSGSSEYITANSDQDADIFEPYDDNVEPLASAEDISEYVDSLAQEQEEEDILYSRFNGEVTVDSWCTCGNCNLARIVKPQECRCCMEIQRCRDIMVDFDETDEEKCILNHPGFNEVCLNEWVLEAASLGLKTKQRKNYSSVFRRSQKTKNEFFRAVSYRQLVRMVWGFIGSPRHLPLPTCCYNAIRSAFPNPKDLEYVGFEEDSDV